MTCCPRDRRVNFGGTSKEDKWRLSFAVVVEGILERQFLRIYVLHLNPQVFCRNIVELKKVNDHSTKNVLCTTLISFSYNARAVSNRLNTKLLFVHVFWSGNFCCLRYEKSTSKVQYKWHFIL